MEKLLLSLGSIALGMAIGQLLLFIEVKRQGTKEVTQPKYIKILRSIALLILGPVIMLGVFWSVDLSDVKLISLPIMGLSSLLLGGGIALLASKIFKHDRRKMGAMFVSGSFTNLGTFGAITCFAFLGEASLAYVYMFNFLENIYYFTVGYPIAKTFGSEKGGNGKGAFLKAFADPYILLTLGSIALGCVLSFTGVKRPEFFADLNSVLIPLMTVSLVTAVGFTMRFSRIRTYLKECITVSAIKYIITPAVLIPAAYFLGLPAIDNGIVFKAVIILSVMSPAFNSLIPPQLYGLDKDLSNSVWLFGTALLVVVLPVLLFFV